MLGLVASGKRSIKRGKEYDSYFSGSTVTGNESELLSDGDVHDTVKLMKKMVGKTLADTKSISQKLKGKTLEQTCSNIWKFLYNHVQYKKDNPLREQLRTPARTWRDRATGVDCDCYTIFISSCLTNLSIPHYMRMAGYGQEFQHIYVVVPRNGKSISGRSSYYVIDPVVNSFNYEVPFKKNSDTMSRVTMLNGFGACDETPIIDRLRHFLPIQQVIQKGGVPAKDFMMANGIPFAPAFNNQEHRSLYVVCTPKGLLQVPTILSPDQAAALKTAVGPLATPPANTTTSSDTAITTAPASDVADKVDALSKKYPWWWIVAAGLGAWILLTGDDQSEVQSGLKGVDNKTEPKSLSGPKLKKKKAAHRAISI